MSEEREMQVIHDQTARDLLGAAEAALDLDALRSHPDCVSMINENGLVMQVSRGSLTALDADTDADLIGSVWTQMWPKTVQTALQVAVERGFSGHITQYWSTFEHADGSISQWDIRLSPVHDARDQVKSVLAMSRKLSPQ